MVGLWLPTSSKRRYWAASTGVISSGKLTGRRGQRYGTAGELVRSGSGVARSAALTASGDRCDAIEARLAALRSQHAKEMRPVEEVIEEALNVLAEDSRRLLTLPVEAVRELVNHLIADATVDMETKAVELKLTLPIRALEAKPKKNQKRKNDEEAVAESTDAMCPATCLRSRAGSWTQRPLTLGEAKCVYLKQPAACYQCRRSAA